LIVLIVVVKNNSIIVQHIRRATQEKSSEPLLKPRQEFTLDQNGIERTNRGQAYDTGKIGLKSGEKQ
jgi:hypothetical protein